MIRKNLLLTMVMFLFIVPATYGFTVDGPTNFEGPGGGIVRFDSVFISAQMNVVNLIYRFTSTVFGGVGTGSVGFDCDTGDNMTITGITATTLTYTISGAGQQRIYFQGYGRPNEISGGTVVVGVGQSLVVTTVGPRTVTLTWFTKFNYIVESITAYLVIIGLVPLIYAAAMLIFMSQSGEFDMAQFMFIVSTTIALYAILLVWGAITKTV